MIDLRTAAQQALDALVSQFDGRADAIDILSAALAEPVQEPVAWMYHGIRHDGTPHDRPSLIWRPEYMDAMSADKGAKATPLYTAPPQRKPLTADETMQLVNETAGQHWCDEAHLQRFRVAIEKAHGIE